VPPNVKYEKDIPIANFGFSNMGIFKQIYRNGLSNRYGRYMQAISGIHYNYSLDDSLLKVLFEKDSHRDFKNSKSEIYFKMLRNIYRMNWLILYLFGASPFLTKSLMRGSKEGFKQLDKDTYFLQYATSLRMSNFGYQNSLRASVNISTASLEKFIDDLLLATKTVSQDFKKMYTDKESKSMQLNENLLQIDDEYYAIARPKSRINSNKRLASKLAEGGVDFIELRSIDLNPFNKCGINQETIYFLEVFLIYCSLTESKEINNYEMEQIRKNDSIVSKYGRKPDLSLLRDADKISLKCWGNMILDEMSPIAESMNGKGIQYSDIINNIRPIINNPELTLSGQLLKCALDEQNDLHDLGTAIGEENKNHYLNIDKTENSIWELLKKESKDSIERQQELESNTDYSYESFLKEYLDY